MSTPLPPPPGYVSIEEFNQLRQQNEQLWKIIERQRTMIQNLQKENSHLSAERDGLQDNVNSFERIRKQRASILVSTEVLKAMSDIEDEPSPMPPPRSPYRANTIGKTDHQQQQQQRSKDKPINVDTTLENNNNNNTIDTTSINNNNNNNNINPTSPKNLIMEKDASNMQKFKSVKPPIVPIPSISSPTITTAHNNNNNMVEESSLSSSFSSSTSSYLRPNSPPTNNQRNNQRSKRESHIFFSPPPLTTSMDAPAMPSLDSIDQINHIPVSSPSPTPPTPPPHHLPSSSSSSPSPSTTIQPQSTDNNNNNHNPLATGITNISLKVLGSNIRQNEKGREVISFIISVGKKPDETNLEFEELWRVEKLYSHFLDLDAKIKSSRNKTAYSRIAKLPDKTLFTSHSPSKVDRRKAALENYLQHIVLLPPEDSSDLCEFLSTNVVDNDVMYSRTGRKEGYLTKRGKNFGGWKTRFFVLNGTNLDYYESKEGNHLGTIRLINAQIGRQTPQAAASASATDENNIYRHAFLIIEQKRAGSSQIARHILCAENDEDRDSWVDALFKHVRLEEDIALHPSDPSLSSSSFPSPAKKKSSISSTTSSSKPMASTSTPSTLPSSNKSSSSSSHPYHQQQDASEFDKLRTYQNSPSEIGMAVTGSTLTNDSSSSLTSTWSSSTSPPPLPPIVLDNYHHPLQQQNNNNTISFSNSLQPHQPSHNLTRRSSMVNLLNKSQEEEITLPARAVSPSPAFGRSSDELLGDDLPEKKSKHKRMTFWGKKMFSSNTSESTAPFDTQSMHSNLSNHTTSTSNSTLVGSTTSSSANTLTTATTGSSSSGFRGFLSRPSNEQGRSHHHKDNQHQPQNPVFGVPLDDAVRISRVSDTYQLPSIVYRCIEYLDVKKAILEEGLYRLSGSNTMMKSLKLKFDQEGDINLLAAKEEYDVHAIAGLLKMWLRELPTSVLTRELRMDFLHVIDRKDRVNELGRLVSLLPIANYTLLRALTAHLIQVVQHSDINKMTMRNVSIVFSPTLGIPGTIFNLLMSEFDYIFWTTEDGDAAPRMILDDENTEYETPIKIIEEAPPPPSINDNNNNYYNGNNINHQQQQQQSHPYDTNQQTNHPDHNNNSNSCSGKPLGRRPTLQLKDGRSNRNSINYREAAPNAIVDLEKHHSGQQALMLDEIEDEVNDLALSDDEDYSIISDDKLQPTAITI
ncbi:hypothetical protein BJ944DRAFT_128634 [Cunninghamella echinulata]|nr:hypothetical protein BJ944DRAFT_128634 [Cunninghamella echinulata]